jgi:cyanophycin synthetase
VEVAVLETARGGILREGLAFDECQVGVVTNVTADHLGMGPIQTLDQLANVKQVVIEAVSKEGAAVLNAEDKLVAQMAAAARGRVVYFARSATHPVMAAHLAEGEAGVYVEDGYIVVAQGKQTVELVESERIGFTLGGKIDFQVMNALAATAAAWAAGLNPAMIARALTTFETDEVTVPGRFNRMEVNGIELIIDYGHNPAALAALGQAIRALEPRYTSMALTLPGDRRDSDLRESVLATLPYVDEYVLYEPEDRRGRLEGEICERMRRDLPPDKPYQMVDGQFEAMRRGLQRLKPGDRLVVIVEHVDEALAYVQSLAAAAGGDQDCTQPVTVEMGLAAASREGNGIAVAAAAPLGAAGKNRNGQP